MPATIEHSGADLVQQELGVETNQDFYAPGFDAAELPNFVFRAMSDEHYQKSLREGFHQSDERGNYIGQAKADPELWEGEKPVPEGTVAGRWAYIGYISNSPDGIGRIVKIQVHPDDGWELHPDDDEGGYYRTFKPIPVERFISASAPIDSRSWNYA